MRDVRSPYRLPRTPMRATAPSPAAKGNRRYAGSARRAPSSHAVNVTRGWLLSKEGAVRIAAGLRREEANVTVHISSTQRSPARPSAQAAAVAASTRNENTGRGGSDGFTNRDSFAPRKGKWPGGSP